MTVFPEEPESPRPPVALCLAGGGLAGAFFELGAVAALEEGLPGWRAARSRVIVGTSCGAVAGALLAFGLSPAEIPAALTDREHPLAGRIPRLSRFLWGDHLRATGGVLGRLPKMLRRSFGGGDPFWPETAGEFQRRLPGGLFSNAGLGDLIGRAARRQGREDRFEDLLAPLRITALDLDTGERAVYGADAASCPVSVAVRASSAIPGFFAPVRIGDRDLVDGQILDPVHLDLAGGFEAELIVVVNPLAPYRRAGASDGPRVRAMGVGAVMEQMSRVSAGIKLDASRAKFLREHPGVRLLEVNASDADVAELIRATTGPASLVRVWGLGSAAAKRTLEAEPA
jgi:NTE family protein